jgi:hypothetical protein
MELLFRNRLRRWAIIIRRNRSGKEESQARAPEFAKDDFGLEGVLGIGVGGLRFIVRSEDPAS